MSRLRNMLPRYAFDYASNTSAINTKVAGQLVDTNALSMQQTNLRNFGISKFGVMALYSSLKVLRMKPRTVAIPCAVAPFIDGISHVVLTCSEKQVFGVDAITYIAPMANEQTIRNRAVVQLVGKSMRTHCLRSGSYVAITIRSSPPSPQPTGFSFPDGTPKTFYRSTVSPNVLVPLNKMKGLVFTDASFVIGAIRKRRGLTATALAQMRAVKAQLNNFWYTCHANASLKVLVVPGAITVAPRFLHA